MVAACSGFQPPDFARIRAWIYRLLAVAYASGGRLDDARQTLTEAVRIFAFETVRSDVQWWGSEDAIAQTRQYQEVLRKAGLRDHGDENADFGVQPDTNLHLDIFGYTPPAVPGAVTIRTDELVPFLARSKPIVIETLVYVLDRSLPGTIGLFRSGFGGDFSDAMQERLRRKKRQT